MNALIACHIGVCAPQNGPITGSEAVLLTVWGLAIVLAIFGVVSSGSSRTTK